VLRDHFLPAALSGSAKSGLRLASRVTTFGVTPHDGDDAFDVIRLSGYFRGTGSDSRFQIMLML
jgi:hypothetical protein